MPFTTSIRTGDISQEKADIIVNAASWTLRGGGGVDGAIHRAAGFGLLQECFPLGPCAHGDIRVTGAHRLDAKWVVHAVGPIWKGSSSGEDNALASCYRLSLEKAAELGARSILFPAISAGSYGFPVERAAGVVHDTFLKFAAAHPVTDLDVRIVLFDEAAFHTFTSRFEQTVPVERQHHREREI